MAVLDWDAAFDLTPNAYAPLAPWAEALRDRGSFAPRARGPDLFDCWGIVTFVQRELDRPVRDYGEFYSEADFACDGGLDRLMRTEAEAFVSVARGDVGDILVCARGGRASHVAVLCGAGRALHALHGAGVVIDAIVGRRAVTRFAGMKVVGCVRPA